MWNETDGDAERRLAQAASRSPDVAAAMLRADRDRGSGRYRRLALIVLGCTAGLGVAWYATTSLAHRTSEQRSEPAQEVDWSHYLRPMKMQPVPGKAEATAPFTGFAVSVESEPPGAVVTIAGVRRGEAPVLAGLDCRPGDVIEIRAEKQGFLPARTTTACRSDELVKLTILLQR